MWLENKDKEEALKQPGQVNTPTVGAGGGASMAGGSTTPATGNFSTTSPVQVPQTTQKWATAQDYLRANQPQATEMGKKVEASLTGTLGEQRGAIESATQKAQQDITGGITAFNPEIVSTAATKPTEITQSPERLQDFMKQWNAAYTGPTSFETSESYTPAAEAAAKGKEISEEIKTPGGRTQLLQNQFGVYGAGNQALDTSLLGQAANYGQIQQLAPQFASLQDYLTQQSQGLSGQVQQAQATTQAAQQQTRTALEGNLQKFQTDLAARVGTTQADAQAKTQQYLADLATGDVNKVANDLRIAGITEDQIKPIIDNLTILHEQYKYNPDLSQGYQYNPATEVTTENVATPEDYAKAQAWAKLTGEQGYTNILNPEQAAQAGQIPDVNKGFLPDYLKQQTGTLVKQKDDYLLGNDAVSFKNLAPDLGTIKIINPKDPNDPGVQKLVPATQAGRKLALQYIDALNRSGITPESIKQQTTYKGYMNADKGWPLSIQTLLQQQNSGQLLNELSANAMSGGFRKELETWLGMPIQYWD
jgi:hypothetical protein